MRQGHGETRRHQETCSFEAIINIKHGYNNGSNIIDASHHYEMCPMLLAVPSSMKLGPCRQTSWGIIGGSCSIVKLVPYYSTSLLMLLCRVFWQVATVDGWSTVIYITVGKNNPCACATCHIHI